MACAMAFMERLALQQQEQAAVAQLRKRLPFSSTARPVVLIGEAVKAAIGKLRGPAPGLDVDPSPP